MLFDSTLRRELARTFGATLVVIVTIVLTIMFISALRQAALGQVDAQDVALLLAYIALGQLPTMLALSLFIAVVGTLGRMYRGSEMTIWFASGISLTRFVRPVLRTSWPVLLVVALLALFVWPWQNERSAALKDRFDRRPDLSRIAPGQFQTSADGQRVFFYEGPTEAADTGRNIFILTTRGNVESVTTAHTGHIEARADGRTIVLTRGQRNEQNAQSGEKTLSRFESYETLAGGRTLSGAAERGSRTLATLELLQTPNLRNQGELVWRLGLVLGAANLTLLGIGLSAANPRHASNWNLLFALLTFFVYYNVINLTSAWVESGRTPMAATLLAAHGGAFVLALLLLWWREHANGHFTRPGKPAPSASNTAPAASS